MISQEALPDEHAYRYMNMRSGRLATFAHIGISGSPAWSWWERPGRRTGPAARARGSSPGGELGAGSAGRCGAAGQDGGAAGAAGHRPGVRDADHIA